MFSLTNEPIDPSVHSAGLELLEAGAVVTFAGRVRNHNAGRAVTALEYSAYPALAVKVGEKIVTEEIARHGALAAVAVHRTGWLALGELAVWCGVASSHRRAAFATATAIVERLKYELPIWKKEQYTGGDSGWVGPDNLPADQSPPPPVWSAKLEAIYISPGHDFRGRHGQGRLEHGMESVSEVECIPGRGLRGDRYAEREANHKAQVTFFDAATVDAVRTRSGLADLPGSVFRRNLIVRGVRLGEWIGRRFVFQGILFEGSEECRPCYWMDEVAGPGTEDFLMADAGGGLRARILGGGYLRVDS